MNGDNNIPKKWNEIMTIDFLYALSDSAALS